jgi:hypothetical protein
MRTARFSLIQQFAAGARAKRRGAVDASAGNVLAAKIVGIVGREAAVVVLGFRFEARRTISFI